MNQQWLSLNQFAPSKRIYEVINILKESKAQLKILNKKGFRADDRSFTDSFEPTLCALEAILVDRKNEIDLLDHI